MRGICHGTLIIVFLIFARKECASRMMSCLARMSVCLYDVFRAEPTRPSKHENTIITKESTRKTCSSSTGGMRSLNVQKPSQFDLGGSTIARIRKPAAFTAALHGTVNCHCNRCRMNLVHSRAYFPAISPEFDFEHRASFFSMTIDGKSISNFLK